MNKVNQQVMILESIQQVRKEMRKAHMSGASSIEMFEIMERLNTLYALINAEDLINAVSQNEEQKMAA